MITKKIFFFVCFLHGVCIQSKELVDYVNPYMGNISHMLVPTYPMIHLPNSMLRIRPERENYTSCYIHGLQVVTPSHRGESAFRISPHSGIKKNILPVIKYSYDNEVIKPYLYSVFLDEEQIDVKFAPSHQSAIYRFKFYKEDNAKITFHSGDGTLEYKDGAISGYQNLGHDTKVYLFLESDFIPEHINQMSENNIMFSFPNGIKEVHLKYGISFISVEQAKKNLRREISHFDLSQISKNGRKIWNENLGKISVKGGSENQKSIFYTSLYRTYERMISISEDGYYWSGIDKQVHKDNGIPFYVDDWVWDAYLTHHPLRILLDPEKQSHILASYIRMANQSKEGWMPTFPEVHHDSHRMNGNHAVSIFADAMNKGIPFDVSTAYQSCKRSILEETHAPWTRKPAGKFDKHYHQFGYFPALEPGEKEFLEGINGGERRQAVAVTLEASYDDFCLSLLADSLGYLEDKETFSKRMLNYRNLFNPETHFFHPKNMNGKFIENIDYKFSGGLGARDYYDENNGWTFRWNVKHNIQDIINLMGGADNFERNLDQLFDEDLGKVKWEFWNALPDQTGNVGQYSMGNEPSFHIPYLYNFINKPWKTQKRIRSLLDQWFRNDLMGIPGDEDGGAMSAFVIFSYMGIYPITPGLPFYTIGSPIFDEVQINLSNNKKFIIKAKNTSRENKYILSAKLNGIDFNQINLNHDDLMLGGELCLIMGDKPNTEWIDNNK